MIRDCVHDDVSWLVALGTERYGGIEEGYSDAAAALWVRRIIGVPDVIAVRGEMSAAFAFITRPAWAPGTSYCDLGMVFASRDNRAPFEPLYLLRAIDKKRREMGCSRFYIHSSYSDISVLARRLGGRPLSASYVVEV